MTLRELRAAHPSLFYAQDWFSDEPFMDVAVPEIGRDRRAPTGAERFTGRHRGSEMPRAATFAQLYVADPKNPIWTKHYFWCADVDRLGQRVFVGSNGCGLEIHRHIAITDRFGVAVWATAT